MHPAGLLAPVLALLANGTSVLDCVCLSIHNQTDGGRAVLNTTLSEGESRIWWDYCQSLGHYTLVESCETLEQSSAVFPAVAQLVPWDGLGLGQPPHAGGEECGAALAAVRGLTREAARKVACHVADVATDDESYSALALNDTKWSVETLKTDRMRNRTLFQLLHSARRITKAIHGNIQCAKAVWTHFLMDSNTTGSRSRVLLEAALKDVSKYWRNAARLLPVSATLLSRLFIPLAFEHLGNHTNTEHLDRWMKNMELVRDMLDTKLKGLVDVVQYVSEHVENYKIEEDKNKPGFYKIRRPLLSAGLLKYQVEFLSFRDEFSALCEEQQPDSSEMFGLADTLYSFHRQNLMLDWPETSEDHYIVDQQWQLEDQSNTTVWVDTGCLQLLADTLDHPRCPLEELPLVASRVRRQCRHLLWQDLVERPARPPVTSYLAYNDRAAVSLCLLAWMVANSFGICQDVPFSIVQSVHDARCYFDSPSNHSCLASKDSDAICSVSRAILLLNCHDFCYFQLHKICIISVDTPGLYSQANITREKGSYRLTEKPTLRILNYKDNLNCATLKYNVFRIYSLKNLEYSFILVNILFRFLTAGIYMYLPQLRNLPGKIILSFQITGIIKFLCSEFVYRMLGLPELSMAEMIDNTLTLLGCFWLNSFCFQMYACVRHLRLPSDLTPAEERRVFCRQLLYVLIVSSVVCSACIVLEQTNSYYLYLSRIIFHVAILVSIVINFVYLALVAHMYLRSQKSMKELEIISCNKFDRKKHLSVAFKAITLSGIGVYFRSASFHVVHGIGQFVYYVHIASMLQGPLTFVFFICNERVMSALHNKILLWWRPDIINPGQELCSSAERNLVRRVNKQSPTAESSL